MPFSVYAYCRDEHLSPCPATRPIGSLVPPVCSLLCCESNFVFQFFCLFVCLVEFGEGLNIDVQLSWAVWEGPCGEQVLADRGGREKWSSMI